MNNENIINAQTDRSSSQYIEELKEIEAVPILMAMMGAAIADIKSSIKPEWCIRRETAMMYQVILKNSVNDVPQSLYPFFNDEYVTKARQTIDINNVSLKRIAERMKDGYQYRESTEAIGAYLHATTQSARRFNIKRLEQLEDMLHDDGPINGLKVVDMTNRSPSIEYCVQTNGVYWIPRKEMTAIKGRAKHGKSHLISIIMSAMLGQHDICGIDVIDQSKHLRLLYVDTEQSMSSTEGIVSLALKMAGLPTDVNSEYLTTINLRSVKKTDRKRAIERYLCTGQYDVVFVDGLKDLCLDFNDLKEADQLMVDILDLVETYNVAYVTVIHENPGDGTNKMRGHLGTEAENKAFEILEASLQDGVFNIINTERRAKTIPTFAFRFNDDNELEACEPNKNTNGSAGPGPQSPTKEEKDWRQFSKAYESNPSLGLTQEEIVRNLLSIGMKETTIKRRLKTYEAQRKIKKYSTTTANGAEEFRYELLDKSGIIFDEVQTDEF